MIVWSHKNVTNSILDLRTMLQLQQESGFIPEEIFWSERTDLENAQLLLTYSNINYTGNSYTFNYKMICNLLLILSTLL
jgi:hypothetical protein